MHTLILSDIHANATALEAVLKDAPEYQQVWCLGDIVGYGPDPNTCVDILRDLPNLTCILGNHDAAITGVIDLAAFNREAQAAIQVQARLLTPESRAFLEDLEISVVRDDIRLVHGSPRNPIWEYVLSDYTAALNFAAYSTQICLIGHSHVPSIFVEEANEEVSVILPNANETWQSEKRFMLNPGSVGQPRDHDPRAAYASLENETGIFTFHRVEYDFATVQKRIRELGIPRRHADRLSQGI